MLTNVYHESDCRTHISLRCVTLVAENTVFNNLYLKANICLLGFLFHQKPGASIAIFTFSSIEQNEHYFS
jgi:hypothetical protein